MNSIIEQVLQLPKEQKLELFYALQEELEMADNEVFYSDELMTKLEKRAQDIEDKKASFISMEEFNSKLQNLRNELRSKRS